MLLLKSCVSHEKNCRRMQTRSLGQALIMLYENLFPFFSPSAFAFLWSEGFSVFWPSQKQSYHLQLHLNTTALWRNAASGTQMISTCAQVFPAYFSNAKHPAVKANATRTGCRNGALAYKRIHYVKSCSTHIFCVSQPI